MLHNANIGTHRNFNWVDPHYNLQWWHHIRYSKLALPTFTVQQTKLDTVKHLMAMHYYSVWSAWAVYTTIHKFVLPTLFANVAHAMLAQLQICKIRDKPMGEREKKGGEEKSAKTRHFFAFLLHSLAFFEHFWHMCKHLKIARYTYFWTVKKSWFMYYYHLWL